MGSKVGWLSIVGSALGSKVGRPSKEGSKVGSSVGAIGAFSPAGLAVGA